MVRRVRADRGKRPPLIDALSERSGAEALRFGERALTYADLHDVAAGVAERLQDAGRVAVWALPALETCAAVVGALAAGATVVPINPSSGERELAHVVADAAPDAVFAPPGTA